MPIECGIILIWYDFKLRRSARRAAIPTHSSLLLAFSLSMVLIYSPLRLNRFRYDFVAIQLPNHNLLICSKCNVWINCAPLCARRSISLEVSHKETRNWIDIETNAWKINAARFFCLFCSQIFSGRAQQCQFPNINSLLKKKPLTGLIVNPFDRNMRDSHLHWDGAPSFFVGSLLAHILFIVFVTFRECGTTYTIGLRVQFVMKWVRVWVVLPKMRFPSLAAGQPEKIWWQKIRLMDYIESISMVFYVHTPALAVHKGL